MRRGESIFLQSTVYLKERIISSLHRHISIERAVLQRGKDLGMDRPENAVIDLEQLNINSV